MASNRASSYGPDARDCADAVRAFETQNNVRIVVTIRPQRDSPEADLWLEGKALTVPAAGAVPVLLAFASVKVLGGGSLTVDAAYLKMLYALDFQLAEEEWQRENKTAKAVPGAQKEKQEKID